MTVHERQLNPRLIGSWPKALRQRLSSFRSGDYSELTPVLGFRHRKRQSDCFAKTLSQLRELAAVPSVQDTTLAFGDKALAAHLSNYVRFA